MTQNHQHSELDIFWVNPGLGRHLRKAVPRAEKPLALPCRMQYSATFSQWKQEWHRPCCQRTAKHPGPEHNTPPWGGCSGSTVITQEKRKGASACSFALPEGQSLEQTHSVYVRKCRSRCTNLWCLIFIALNYTFFLITIALSTWQNSAQANFHKVGMGRGGGVSSFPWRIHQDLYIRSSKISLRLLQTLLMSFQSALLWFKIDEIFNNLLA